MEGHILAQAELMGTFTRQENLLQRKNKSAGMGIVGTIPNLSCFFPGIGGNVNLNQIIGSFLV